MTMETLPSDYLKLVSEFLTRVDTLPTDGFIPDEHLSGNWKLVGDEAYANKMTFINDRVGVFIKYYPPRTGDYAQKALQTIKESASIEGLPYPILTPEALINGALVFKAGKHVSNVTFESLGKQVKDQMSEIVSKNGLKPLDRFSEMAVIKVGEEKYLADIFDDSVYSISQYCERD